LNLLVRESGIGDVAARVASVLLLLSQGEAGLIAGEVNITRLSRATALDADVVERLLRQWSEAGIIKVNRRQMSIENIESLRHIAG
jgi:hypothetical protein